MVFSDVYYGKFIVPFSVYKNNLHGYSVHGEVRNSIQRLVSLSLYLENDNFVIAINGTIISEKYRDNSEVKFWMMKLFDIVINSANLKSHVSTIGEYILTLTKLLK